MNKKIAPDIGGELDLYCQEVLSGKIITCKKHKWACMRWVKDRKRSMEEPDYPYRFDNEMADKFFRWCSLFKHSKGPLSGKYIDLAPILRFIFGNIFGWVHKDSGLRRFTKLYWQVARKNAKSQMLALVLTFMCFADGEGSAEIFCAATKREQARVVYDECKLMVIQGLPKDKYNISYGRINHPKTGSFIRALSKEDGKLGDGFNAHAAAIDEYHAHHTSEVYDVVASSMGAREQPLHATITTAGFDLEYPCYKSEYFLVSRILDPNVDFNLENYFCMVNELDKDDQGQLIDDIKDESCWIKSNPIIMTYPVGIKGMRKDFEEAIGVADKMRNFLTKRLNIWMNMRECGYMDMERWKNCSAVKSGRAFPDLVGVPCYVGVDLSAKIDLSSISIIWPIGDLYFVYSHSFIPEETLFAKMKTDKVPYQMWADQGYITITSGATIDYRAVMEFVIKKSKDERWRIAEFCVDSWGAIQLNSDLIERGYTVIEIVQGIKTLSEPTKDFRSMVYAKRVVHDDNPVLSWAMSNAIVDNPNRDVDNIILNKKKSIQRIDPVASLINAHVRAMHIENVAPPKVVFI